MEIQDLQHLKALVTDNQGIITVQMKVLRDAANVGQALKPFVREKISNELRKIGLAHTELPNSQNMPVRVYQSGSPVATILEAAKEIEEGGKYDEILRKASMNDHTELLAEVRNLRDEAATLDRIRDILQCNEQ